MKTAKQRLKELYFDEVPKPPTDRDRNDRVLIVDGLNTYIRIWSAVPALNDDGDHVGGVVGFLKSIGALVRQYKPTRCIIVFDGKGGSTRRRKLYPEYKSNRRNKVRLNRFEDFESYDDEQESMKRQFARLAEYLHYLPVTLVSIDNIEADDAIAYITTELLNSEVIISSTDRDFLQLITDKVSVWNPVKKKLYDVKRIEEEYEMAPSNYLLYKCFEGDKSDNIEGVKGVGRKTLLKHFPDFMWHPNYSIEQLYEDVERKNADKKPPKVISIISESREQLELNWKLMCLHEHDISGDIKSRIRAIVDAPIRCMNKFEFKKLFISDKLFANIKDVDSWLQSTFVPLNAHCDD